MLFRSRAFPAALRPAAYAREFLPHLRATGAEVVLATVPVPGCEFYQPHNGILAAAIPAHLDPLPWGVRHLRRANPWRVAHFKVLRSYEARALSPPARVLALSPRVVADLDRFYPDVRPVLLRPGVDLARFRPDGEKNGAPLLLFVATNPQLKGLAAARQALERLPGARLIVVGTGGPSSERIEYRPHESDLPALYRRADVLVHPTWYDTASLVVLEALASGTPVVTTTRDGNADLAVEGGGAALDEPGDHEALAAAVASVLARRPGNRPRHVAERFPEQEMLDRVVEILTCGSAA